MFNKRKIKELKKELAILEDLANIGGFDPEFSNEEHPYISEKTRAIRNELFKLQGTASI